MEEAERYSCLDKMEVFKAIMHMHYDFKLDAISHVKEEVRSLNICNYYTMLGLRVL